MDKIRHIPTTIVQGRYDVVCPFKTAWELHKRFPEAKFVVNGTAGHSAGEQDNANSLVDAADLWRDQQLALKGLAAAGVQPRFREKQPPGGRTQITFG